MPTRADDPLIRVNLKEYLAKLNATAEQFTSFAEPMETISKNWQGAILSHLHAGSGWPSLAEHTIERWGEHSPLDLTGKLLASILPWSRTFGGGTFSTVAHGPLHDTWGRKAGSGLARSAKIRKGARRGSTTTKAGRLSRYEKRHGYDVGAEGRVGWGPMPARPFMFVDSKMEDFALTTLADFVGAEWGDK